MTTTDSTETIKRSTHEILAPWLSLYMSEIESEGHASDHRSWILRQAGAADSHSSLSAFVSQTERSQTISSSLWVGEAHSLRAQILENGSVALQMAVPGGYATAYLPFSPQQIIDAILAEMSSHE